MVHLKLVVGAVLLQRTWRWFSKRKRVLPQKNDDEVLVRRASDSRTAPVFVFERNWIEGWKKSLF